MRSGKARLLSERSMEGQTSTNGKSARPKRSVTVNLTESPLGWLFARGHVSGRQYEAGDSSRRLGARSTSAASDDGLGRRTPLARPRRFGART